MPQRSIVALVVAAHTIAAPLGAQGAPTAERRASPDRIVTLGAAVTETVVALGRGDRIVGFDRSSAAFAPAAAASLDFFRNTSAEGVLALRPALVLAIDGSGPPASLEQIGAAGVRVQELAPATDPASAAERIRAIAALVDAVSEGAALAQRVEQDANRMAAIAASAPLAPRVLAIYARGTGTLFVSGGGTPMDAMLRLAHAQNAVTAFTQFRPLTPEAVIAAAPDYILLPERGLASIGGVEGVLALPGIAETPAGRRRAIVTVDDHLLLGFGPRLAEGIRRLAVALHPELAARLAEPRQ